VPPFQGRQEVLRLKQRLDDTFKRADDIDPSSLELRSDFARYLCVLVAGYLERATQELTIEWCRKQSSPSIQRYASRRLKGLQNVNGARLFETLGDFEPLWRSELESDYGEEIDVLNSLYGNRHRIAHGNDVGLTLVQIKEHYRSVQRLVQFMIDRLDPATT
jgi:hypothetical protein